MKFEELPGFMIFLFEEVSNEELLEAWRSNPFREESFEEFKENIRQETIQRSKSKEEIEQEANEAKDKALASLNKFDGGGQLGG